MTEPLRIEMDSRELDRIAKKIDTAVENVVTAMAFKIAQMAKQMAPVKTGALKNSIYTATRKSNALPSVSGRKVHKLPTPESPDIAVVGPSVEYGFYVEHGRGSGSENGRGRGAQPYLAPAFEYIMRKLNAGDFGRELEKKL